MVPNLPWTFLSEDEVIDKPKLTSQHTLHLLQEIVRDLGPSHTAERCLYVDKNLVPMCIVGHLLIRAGLSRDFLADYNTWPVDSSRLANALAEEIHITPQAYALLTIAQEVQDGGAIWGDVLCQVEYAVAQLPVGVVA